MPEPAPDARQFPRLSLIHILPFRLQLIDLALETLLVRRVGLDRTCVLLHGRPVIVDRGLGWVYGRLALCGGGLGAGLGLSLIHISGQCGAATARRGRTVPELPEGRGIARHAFQLDRLSDLSVGQSEPQLERVGVRYFSEPGTTMKEKRAR